MRIAFICSDGGSLPDNDDLDAEGGLGGEGGLGVEGGLDGEEQGRAFPRASTQSSLWTHQLLQRRFCHRGLRPKRALKVSQVG